MLSRRSIAGDGVLATTSAAIDPELDQRPPQHADARPGAAGPQQGAQQSARSRRARASRSRRRSAAGTSGPDGPVAATSASGEDQPVDQVLLDHRGSARQQAGGDEQPHRPGRPRTASSASAELAITRGTPTISALISWAPSGGLPPGPPATAAQAAPRRPASSQPARPARPRPGGPGPAPAAGRRPPHRGRGPAGRPAAPGRAVHEQAAVHHRAVVCQLPATRSSPPSSGNGKRPTNGIRRRPREQDGADHRGPSAWSQVTKPGVPATPRR